MGIFEVPTLQRHYTENSKQICPEMKLRGLDPNSYIHVSVSDYIFLLYDRSAYPAAGKRVGWSDRWNIRVYIAHRYVNVEIRTEAAQFLFGEYRNRIFFAVHILVS